MSQADNIETVEVKFKIPKNVQKALQDIILPFNEMTEQQYWDETGVQSIIADIDCIACERKQDPKDIFRKYGILQYYQG